MSRHAPLSLALFASAVWPLPMAAQIVVDGTLGPAGALTGPSYTIAETLGTQIGGNLFHSFSDFNVRAGETATFTSAFAGTTTNVVSRVTGASASRFASPLVPPGSASVTPVPWIIVRDGPFDPMVTRKAV